MKYQINLIHRRKKELTEKTLYFIYNYLRYILVITQIIVIFVFFNKIRYDQEIVDLQETIYQQKEIINVSKPLIDEYLLLKKKIDVIKKISDNQTLPINQLNYLLSIFPKEVFLREMKYDKGSLSLVGESPDISLIKAFYNKLKKDNVFHDVSLIKLEKDNFNFVFNIYLNNFK